MKESNLKLKYEKRKKRFLTDSNICIKNRALYEHFLDEQEYKLKRQNNLSRLDNQCYKTLYDYITKIGNVNRWFKNKSIESLTRNDIQKVYDNLEDGKILNGWGKPYTGLHDSYYGRLFKSRLFEMAGKLELAKDIFRYESRGEKEVRFITEKTFKKIIGTSSKIHHLVLFWLAWDIGENINALLQLRKSDCYRELNPDTKEPEYRINLRREILKRSRRARSEITNYSETVKLLDQYLSCLDEDDELFDFGYRTAKKIIDRTVEKVNAKCEPIGDKPTWKDLRNGMACDLLKKGWTTDEVNARLGHKPSSDEIDKYVNFLALDRHRPKRKVKEFEMEIMQRELEDLKQREKLIIRRNESLQEQIDSIKHDVVNSVKRMLRDGRIKIAD